MADPAKDKLLQAIEELRRDMQGQIDALKASLDALLARPAAPAVPHVAETEVSPETLVILAAAAATYLGRNIKVRSAKMLSMPYGAASPWAQHGRVFVQASHNLPRRR